MVTRAWTVLWGNQACGGLTEAGDEQREPGQTSGEPMAWASSSLQVLPPLSSLNRMEGGVLLISGALLTWSSVVVAMACRELAVKQPFSTGLCAGTTATHLNLRSRELGEFKGHSAACDSGLYDGTVHTVTLPSAADCQDSCWYPLRGCWARTTSLYFKARWSRA